ncbi:ParB/RepB/Spo0J family partition protein [Aestuariirhabdus litorea]|uniref:Probable chromosome-partitioning protein ParB n=1 Tax=Aestuariirhabdus litorea TaxID=2528527 RepID=A0A3P3VL65_9GAMM|nr:ParB/RepB/Spo0J family partition protein [Aestuariirhabdus litorea]RRJ82618.1 ParB/RepB/Spo0J family partition protein [Aestuariirhabdus litorea]RWW92778.1 ParB/RepB/Spo0J family partition protein [Endozoicomonadaceae bacterium GTF-13]
MAVKKRGLGRGLDALLAGSALPKAEGESATKASTDGKLAQIPVEFIQRGKYQPRRDMQPEALEELANSIKAQGVMQPIVIRPIGVDRYEIIAGERRWRAAQKASLDRIPAIIRDVPDEAAIAMALIENIQREDLNPVEEALALQRLQEEFELTQQQVADAVGKSRTTVTNLLRLIGLNPEVRTMLEHGDLEMGHARAMLTLNETQQLEAAREVVARALSVRQTEALIRKLQQQASSPKPEQAVNPDIRNLQDSLSERLGAAVRIDHSARGKGKLVIQYNNLDELDGILAHIK